MSGTSDLLPPNPNLLTLKHSFGCKSDVTSGIVYIDDVTVAYPVGNMVVIYNVEHRTQEFIFLTDSPHTNPPFVSQGITALAISPNKRMLCVAERTGDRGIVTIYDCNNNFKRRGRPVWYADTKSKEIISVSFSTDNKFMVTLGGAPDYPLALWNVEKPQPEKKTTVKLIEHQPTGGGATKAEFCPTDNNLICCSGDGNLRFVRIQNMSFTVVSVILKREVINFVTHTWVQDEKVVASSDKGDLYLIEGFELKQAIHHPKDEDEIGPIKALAAFSKGFIAGGKDGRMLIFERYENTRELYKRTKTVTIDPEDICSKEVVDVGNSTERNRKKREAQGITNSRCNCQNIAVSTTEESLIISTDDNQLFSFGLSNIDIAKEEHLSFRHLAYSFHGLNDSGSSSKITALETCAWKPIILTAGVDKTVRIWNYRENSLDLRVKFAREASAAALHPSGIQCLLAFADALKLCSILANDFYVIHDFPVKRSHLCCFSNGGQYIAAAVKNVVYVYKTINAEHVGTYKGHEGDIKAISWKDGDNKFVTSSFDGTLIWWDVLMNNKDVELKSERALNIQSVIFNSVQTKGIVMSKNSMVRIVDSFSNPTITAELPIDPKLNLTSLALSPSENLLYISYGNPDFYIDEISDAISAVDTSNGGSNDDGGTTYIGPAKPPAKVRVVYAKAFLTSDNKRTKDDKHINNQNHNIINNRYQLNKIDDTTRNIVWQDISCHEGPISFIKSSFDGKYFFSAGEDGSICVYEVNDKEPRIKKDNQQQGVIQADLAYEGSTTAVMSEEILVTKDDLEKEIEEMEKYKKQVQNLTKDNQTKLRCKDEYYHEKLEGISKYNKEKLDFQSDLYNQMLEEKRLMELKYRDRLKEISAKHSEEFKILKEQYSKKMENETDRYKELLREKEAMHRKWDEENEVLRESHQEDLYKLTEDYDKQVDQEQREQRRLNEDMKGLEKEMDYKLRVIEEDAEEEVLKISNEFESTIKAEKLLKERLETENTIKNNISLQMSADLQKQTNQLKSLHERLKEHEEAVQICEKDIQLHKKEIREREETMADKDRRILDLKKRNQELEKFKFVLDYKIKELKRQIEPREMEIKKMKIQIDEMNIELEQYQKSHTALHLMTGELKLKVDGLSREEIEQEKQITLSDDYIAAFRRDLKGCTLASSNPKILKTKIIELFRTYVEREDMVVGSKKQEFQEEYNRQRDHLEKSVVALREKIGKDLVLLNSDQQQLTHENVVLTEELNSLRREQKRLENRKARLSRVADTTLGSRARNLFNTTANNEKRKTASRPNSTSVSALGQTEYDKEIEIQQTTIQALEDRVRKLQNLLGLSTAEKVAQLS